MCVCDLLGGVDRPFSAVLKIYFSALALALAFNLAQFFLFRALFRGDVAEHASV
jgi:hypothetical protein